MSDDRYEIRSKIGQGGVGAVYRAFDRHLNREVAIKRVLPEGGYENQEEATKAMLNEAASLCSVQHPNIVTVFDAGIDNDGPYVVMELLSGRTIDEMVDRGTLTYQDFREVALQSQEALIAAQDLDLVHRDIKPTNVMVTWLPSGRFQVKLVDFGLAKFSPKPSPQTIDHGDSVLGSIHFMAPEQFERTPLDKRTDMYSMGCVYYYTLAGVYPFDGETAPQVMNAHLQHQIKPLQEHRPDLPGWLCQWVMWHLARQIEERPRDARESLKLFLMSDNNPENPASQIPLVSTPTQNAAPQMNVPSAAPVITPTSPVIPHVTGPVNTATAPQPILPPEGSAPSIHTEAQMVKDPVIPTPVEPMAPVPDMPNDRKPTGAAAQASMAPPKIEEPAAAAAPKLIIPNSPVQAPAPETETSPDPIQPPSLVTAPAPQPILPPEGSAPSIHTEAQTVKAPVIPTPVEPMAPAPDMPNDRKPTDAPAQAPIAPPKIEEPAAAAAPKLIIPDSPVQAPAPETETSPDPIQSQSLVTAPAPLQVSAPASPETPKMSEPLPSTTGAAPKFNIPEATIQAKAEETSPTPPSAASGPVIKVKGPQLEKVAPKPVETPVLAVAPTVIPAEPDPTPPEETPAISIPAKTGMSGAAKGVIAALLVVGILIAGIVLLGKKAQKDKMARLAEITAPFKAGPSNYPEEIELTKSDITLLLDTIITPDSKEKGVRKTYMEALRIATTTDGSDLDDVVAKYATRTQMSEDARINLFKVLELRSQPSALPHLIDFARSTTEAKLGVAALEATEKMATPDDLEQLLNIVSDAQHGDVRRAAVRTLKTVIKKAPDKSSFAARIISSFRSTTEGEVREQLLQILGTAGGSRAAELISTHLNGSDMKLQLAAIAGLREWPDTGQFETLSTFVENEEEGTMRKQGFAAMIQFLTERPDINGDDLPLLWDDTAPLALSESEQIRVVNAMSKQKGDWALKILDHFMQRGLNDRVTARAEDGKEILKKRLSAGSNDE
ncbi:MAG: protein kinase [Akkermansiaceae bacterium]|nr:protein kinase [Akkermansiaceae bacterium]